MKPVIVDVREPYEFEEGHVKGALNIPQNEITEGAKQLEEVDKATPLIVYCRSGGRANRAAQTLRTMGYTNVTNGINQKEVEATYGL